MTKQPTTEQLADELENTPFLSTRYEAAAELRRLGADKDDWKGASFVFKERAAKAETRIADLEAANAELLESLAGVLKIGRGSSGRIIIEGLQEEAMRAAIAKHGGAA